MNASSNEGVGTTAASKTNLTGVLFEARHVYILLEILAPHSYKWSEICMALNLPYPLILQIRASSLQSPNMCLNSVLQQWVSTDHQHALLPTVKNLKMALSSNIVQLGSVAAGLDKALCDRLSANEELQVPKGGASLQTFPSPFTYRPASGLNSMGLAKMDAFRPSEAIGSNNDNSWLCMCKKVLTNVYLAQPEVPQDSWPPVNNELYINLALIKSSNIGSSEYCRYTIQGDMDDIMKDKESIEYNSMFEDLEGGARLLIEGRPGSGKTTLVHKISRDWGNELCLKNIHLLFFVHLRHFFSDPNIGLCDLIKHHYTNLSTVQQIASYAEEHCGEGLCFILDGLDEYTPPKSKRRSSNVFKLIRKEILPKAVVIVASRPAGSAKIRNVATKQVETLGFLKDEIKQYVSEYKFSSVEKADCLHSYLKDHPNVMHMCYLPLQSAMVCYLYDKMGSSLPRTETEIYTKFTNYTLLRLLRRNSSEDSNIHLTSVNELPEREKRLFALISKLAFEKTTKSLQVMKHSEISESFSDFNSDKDSLGLITVDRAAMVDGEESFYTFHHLTFQEYLAAYYITQLKEDEQIGLIKEYGQNKVMQVVWKFYCGLADFSGEATKFTELMKSSSDLYRVQCAFESQQPITCSSSQSENRLTFDDNFLNPTDFTSIGYVLSNTAQPVEELVLSKCKFGDDGIEALLKEAGKQMSSVKCVRFYGGKCSDEQFQVAVHLFMNLNMETLDLTNTKLGFSKLKILFDSSFSSLQVLQLEEKHLQKGWSKLCGNKLQCIYVPAMDVSRSIQIKVIETFGLQVFISSICSSRTISLSNHEFELRDVGRLLDGIIKHSLCTTLTLSNCNLGNPEAEIIGNALKSTHTLKALILRWNCIEDVGAKSLSEGLKYCNSLKLLDISWNEIGDRGAVDIVSGTCHYQELKCFLWNHKITLHGSQYLDALQSTFQQQNNNFFNYTDAKVINEEIEVLISRLYEPSFHHDSLIALKFELNKDFTQYIRISDSLRHCSKLQKLDLDGIKISGDGIQCLAEGLKHCRNLQTLILSSVGLTGYSIRSFVDSLIHCNNLSTIILDGNKIGNDGIVALTAGLKHCKSLHTLHLNWTDFSSDGAKALAQNLKNYTSLKHLHLDGNTIGSVGASALAEGLQQCDSLSVLHLQDNQIGTDGARAIAEGLQYYSGLQALYLQQNRIGSEGAMAIAKGIKHCSSLRALHLQRNEIGNEGVKHLAECLQHCGSLQALHLDRNEINSDGAKALAEKLNYCSSLQALHLNENNIGSDGAKALTEGLKHCSSLLALHLDRNKIGSEGAVAISEGLKHFNCLCALHLGSNKIGSEGAVAIAEGLNHCSCLHALHLGKNHIGSDGTLAILEALKHCSSLRTLHLDANKICYRDTMAVADGLKYWTSLQNLYLHQNRIGSTGAKALAEGLKNCSDLQVLNLNGGCIHNDGVKALAEGLMDCSHLQDLYLNQNKISSAGAVALTKILKYCRCLRTLHLHKNKIDSEGAKVLAEGLKHCSSLQALYLNLNRVNRNGAKALADGLKYCSYLQTLHLYGVNSDVASVLAEIPNYCGSLHDFHLDHLGLNQVNYNRVTEGPSSPQALHLDRQ